MRSRLNDPTFTYWFFLKGATSPNAGKYHTLAKAPLLALHLLMNINEPLISKITEAEELPSILSSVCHTVVNTKSMDGYKAILVMFDTVGSAGQRLTDAKDYFSLWEDSPGGTTKAMDLEDVFAPLRRISWLFRLAPSSDIVDVLQCLRSLQSTMSDNKMSALLTGYFQGLDLSARSKVMGGMLRLDKAVEGTHRWHEIGGKFYLHVPKKRKQAKDDNDDSRSDAEKHHLSLTNQLSATDASFMAKLIGAGDEAVGVREMTRVIATTNDDAFKEGANDEGHQLLSRLDVPTTVAVQMEIGLSEDQMNQTSSILSHVCGIAPLFADQKARQKYRMDAAKDVGQKFDKAAVRLWNSKEKKMKDTEVEYWTVDVQKVGMRELNNDLYTSYVNEGYEPKNIGVKLLDNKSGGREVVYTLGIDGGGGYERACLTVSSSLGKSQKGRSAQVFNYGPDADENHVVLKIVTKRLIEDMRQIKQSKTIAVYVSTAADKKILLSLKVPKDVNVFAPSTPGDDGKRTFAEGVCWSRPNDDATADAVGIRVGDTEYRFIGENAALSPTDTVVGMHELLHRVLLSGDLQLFATLRGRHGSSGYWCQFCSFCKREWEKAMGANGLVATDGWLLAKSQEVFKNAFPGKNPSEVSLEDVKKYEENLGVRRWGLRWGQAPIFEGVVDIMDFVVPTLHIILGVVKDVWDGFEKVVRLHIQPCSAAVLDANTKWYEASEEVDKLQEALEAVHTPPDWTEYVVFTERLKEIQTKLVSTEGKLLVARPNEQKRLQSEIYALKVDLEKATVDVAEAESKVTELTQKKLVDEKELPQQIKDAEARLSKATTTVNKVLADEPKGPCDEAMKEILHGWKCAKEQYHGGCFIGPHCKIITKNAEKIFSQIKVALKKHKKDTVTDSFIDETVEKYEAILRTFDFCASTMRSTELQTPENIVLFRTTAKKVGEMWRILFPGRATPKIHILESHAPDQLERFGVLGLFSEDPVERLHHQHLVEIRRFCNIREYEKRERYIYSRWAAANTEQCRKIIALWVQRRTRKQSAGTKKVKEEKAEGEKEAKRVKHEGADAFSSKVYGV